MTLRNRPIRAPRKERMWGITDVNFTLSASTAAAMIAVDLMALLRTDLGHTLAGVTASAIRLNVLYRQSVSMDTDEDTIWMGIGWVSDTAIATGGAALPDPSIDHFDWMAHDGRTLKAIGSADVEQSHIGWGAFSVHNDSMRKQRENHSTLVAVFRSTLLQSGAFQVFVQGRVLFLLP